MRATCLPGWQKGGAGEEVVTVRVTLHSFVNLPFTLFTSRSLSTHVGCLLATGFLG